MLSINHRSSKVTHGGRKAGAQHAHANGASIEAIAHHGNWNHRRLVTHYLTQVSKEVPYRMAGFTLPNEEFWLERNTVIPSKELQKMIFPFIEELFPENLDWAIWIENIMDDNPEEFNRARSSKVDYPLASYPAMRLMIILAHLRKVILQDAVVLLSITDDPMCMYGQHEIFMTLSVFSSTMFKEYSLQLRESMRNAQSPLTDSLTANAPAIHHEFRSVKTALGALEAHVQQRDTYVQRRFDGVDRNVEGVSRQLVSISQAIHSTFRNAGQLLGAAATQVSMEHQQQVQRRRQHSRQHPTQEQRGLEQVPERLLNDLGHESNEDAEDQGPNVAEELELGQEQEQQVPLGPSDADLTMLGDEIAMSKIQIQPRDDRFSMKPRDTSLNDHFDEWFAGEPPESPSIWKMNSVYKKGWRKKWNAVDRNHYAFKKRLIEEVLREIHKAEGPTLEEKVTRGIAAVQEAVDRAGSLAKHNKMLQPRRT